MTDPTDQPHDDTSPDLPTAPSKAPLQSVDRQLPEASQPVFARLIALMSGTIRHQRTRPTPVKKQLLAAVITLVVSGLGGALIQHFIERAMPTIAINSVAFTGPQAKLLKLPDNVISASEEDIWGPKLRHYESFDTLTQRERVSSELIERLKKASESSDEWLRKHELSPVPEARQLGPSDIRDHPYMNDDVVGSGLIGSIKRHELKQPPMSVETLTHGKYGELFPIKSSRSTSNNIVLDLRKKSVAFPSEDFEPDQVDQVKLLATSFQYGSAENVRFYTEEFVRNASNEILRLNTLQVALRDFLLPQAHLSVSLSIFNEGGTSMTFRPYFAFRVLHADFQNAVFIMAPSHEEASKDSARPSDPLRALLSGGNDEDDSTAGKDYMAETYLPSQSASAFINIPPQKLVTVTMVSIEPLSDRGALFKSVYESGLLDCKVLGKTDTGRTIWSQPMRLGKSISDSDKVELLKVAGAT